MKRVFNTPEAAEYIGTTERTLRASRSPKSSVKFTGPKYRKIGSRKVVYVREDLDTWIDNLACRG